MTFGTRVKFDDIREKVFTSITSIFTDVGGALTENARILTLNSSLDEPIYISTDGSSIHLRLEPNTTKIFDFCSNKVRNDGLFLATKTQISVKAVNVLPTTGAVWAELVNGEGAQ